MRVALVHYWLKRARGGEKVLRAFCDLFPDAVIFTHIANDAFAKDYFAGHDIRKSFISKLPFAQTHSQYYLPLMPMALEELDLQEFDLVISSESGPAKGVIPRPDARHICYCHTPMRYIWDKYKIYQQSVGIAARTVLPMMAHKLRQWDVSSAARVDSFVANSHAVAARIEKYYRRSSTVIHPPVSVENFAPDAQAKASGPYADAYLWVGELVPYKRPDIAIAAFNQMKRRLVVIGAGVEKRRLQRQAGDTITFRDWVDFDELRRAYASCKALVFPGEEDFGIVPLEAMASGTPVIAFGRGGALETVRHRETGLIYQRADAEGLIEAVEEFERASSDFDPMVLTARVKLFSEAAFKAKFVSFLQQQGVAAPLAEHPTQNLEYLSDTAAQ